MGGCIDTVLVCGKFGDNPIGILDFSFIGGGVPLKLIRKIFKFFSHVWNFRHTKTLYVLFLCFYFYSCASIDRSGVKLFDFFKFLPQSFFVPWLFLKIKAFMSLIGHVLIKMTE